MFAPTKTWRRWHRRIAVNQRRYELWRFDVDNQTTEYFDADGRGMRTFFVPPAYSSSSDTGKVIC